MYCGQRCKGSFSFSRWWSVFVLSVPDPHHLASAGRWRYDQHGLNWIMLENGLPYYYHAEVRQIVPRR
jgi:hypothetical protein